MYKTLVFILLFAVMWTLGAADKTSYKVLWFGDLHYDEVVFHDKSIVNYTPRQQLNFDYYSGIWQKKAPAMLKAAKSRHLDDSDFVIQIGDWIQGDASSAEDKSRQMQKAIQVVTSGINKPVYTLRGNHDARGNGGMEGYRKVILPFLSRQLKKEVTSLNYKFVHGEDLYIFVDSLDIDFDFLEKRLAESGKYRWVFVAAHYALIPPVGSTRCKFGKSPEEVKRLLELFLKHNVILLCGDSHEFYVVQYARKGNKFTQLMSNSVIATPWKDLQSRKEDLTKNMSESMAFLNKDIVSVREWSGAGFAVLRISNKSVDLEYYYTENGYTKPGFAETVRTR